MNHKQPDTSASGLASRVIARIEDEHIRPRPRWYFIFENGVLWSVGAAAVIIGGVAFSGALYDIANAGWQYEAATHDSLLSFLLDTAPYLWILLLCAFVLIGYYNIRLTKRGYRYPFSLIVAGVVLTSASAGLGFSMLGLGSVFENALGNVPFYRPEAALQRELWTRPDRGLIAGWVISRDATTSSFFLKSFDGSLWFVSGDDLRARDEALVSAGAEVRVFGAPAMASSTASSTPFHACFVFPWGLPPSPFLPPPPHIATSAPRMIFRDETNSAGARSVLCTGIRPYASLRSLR
ncbi:hypothetical protein KGQ55_03315 [Patescibacteria group bacterium]|nr:hypothetical protein [Patescibacteria group bacterium]